MKKTKTAAKSISKPSREKSSMPSWAVLVNWVVLATCLVFGLFLFGSAVGGLNEAKIDMGADQQLINSRLWIIAFLFATMGMTFYACVKIYYKNISGYLSYFLALLFFALYMGMMSAPMAASQISNISLSPLFLSVPPFTTYLFVVPAMFLFFAFLLMMKYLKSFSKQDIVLIALYIIFFLFLAPSSLSAGIEFANKALGAK
jgi:hypothetical protein